MLAERGDPAAVDAADRAIASLSGEVPTGQWQAMHVNAALSSWRVGDAAAARRFAIEAAPVSAAGPSIARIHLTIVHAGVALQEERWQEALDLAEAVLDDQHRLGVERDIPLAAAMATRAALALGRPAEARAHAAAAVAAAEALDLAAVAAPALEAVVLLDPDRTDRGHARSSGRRRPRARQAAGPSRHGAGVSGRRVAGRVPRSAPDRTGRARLTSTPARYAAVTLLRLSAAMTSSAHRFGVAALVLLPGLLLAGCSSTAGGGSGSGAVASAKAVASAVASAQGRTAAPAASGPITTGDQLCKLISVSDAQGAVSLTPPLTQQTSGSGLDDEPGCGFASADHAEILSVFLYPLKDNPFNGTRPIMAAGTLTPVPGVGDKAGVNRPGVRRAEGPDHRLGRVGRHEGPPQGRPDRARQAHRVPPPLRGDVQAVGASRSRRNATTRSRASNAGCPVPLAHLARQHRVRGPGEPAGVARATSRAR